MKLCSKLRAATLLLGILLVQGYGTYAQSSLEGYIWEGLKNNLSLQQKHSDVTKATLSLQTANSYFLPAANFSGGYTSGKGGRTIAMPVGDLLNPVYDALNHMTDSRRFPQIENVAQSCFLSHLYDAHVRAILPLLNRNLHHPEDRERSGARQSLGKRL